MMFALFCILQGASIAVAATAIDILDVKTGIHRLFSGTVEDFFQAFHLTNHYKGGVEGVSKLRTWFQK
jgi:hypothetical protein